MTRTRFTFHPAADKINRGTMSLCRNGFLCRFNGPPALSLDVSWYCQRQKYYRTRKQFSLLLKKLSLVWSRRHFCSTNERGICLSFKGICVRARARVFVRVYVCVYVCVLVCVPGSLEWKKRIFVFRCILIISLPAIVFTICRLLQSRFSLYLTRNWTTGAQTDSHFLSCVVFP